jgi:hypothetical protein
MEIPRFPTPKRKFPSSPESLKIVGGEFNSKRKPSKRPRHTTEERTDLQASAMSSSLEGSTNGPDNESQNRQPRPQRFTETKLRQYGEDEDNWNAAVSKACDELAKRITKQSEYVGSFGTLDSDISALITELGEDNMPRSKRLLIQKRLGELEKRRQRTTNLLRLGIFAALSEAFVIKQDCQRWYVKEQTITQLIESCR